MRSTYDLMPEADYVSLLHHARNAGRDWFRAVGERDYPLSGEWAGESIPEISARYDIDLFDWDLANAFEEGYYDEMSEAGGGINYE